MIALSHFGSGNRIALNVDLIEKIEETPDTVITLTNGARYLVKESIDEIIARSAEARANVLRMVSAQVEAESHDGARLRLVKQREDEEAGE